MPEVHPKRGLFRPRHPRGSRLSFTISFLMRPNPFIYCLLSEFPQLRHCPEGSVVASAYVVGPQGEGSVVSGASLDLSLDRCVAPLLFQLGHRWDERLGHSS